MSLPLNTYRCLCMLAMWFLECLCSVLDSRDLTLKEHILFICLLWILTYVRNFVSYVDVWGINGDHPLLSSWPCIP